MCLLQQDVFHETVSLSSNRNNKYLSGRIAVRNNAQCTQNVELNDTKCRVWTVNYETSARLLLCGFFVLLVRVVRLSNHRQQLLELLKLVLSALRLLLFRLHLLLTLLLLSI